MATAGSTPIPIRSVSSSRTTFAWSAASSAMVVHCWPPHPTYWRSSSQMAQCAGGSDVSACWTPQVTQIQAGMPDTVVPGGGPPPGSAPEGRIAARGCAVLEVAGELPAVVRAVDRDREVVPAVAVVRVQVHL